MLAAVGFEPVREALVELSTELFRHGFISGVPDEQVPEPEGVFAGQVCPVVGG